VEKNSCVLGDFVWTAIDYLGESGIGHATISTGEAPEIYSRPYPWFNSYCGDIDLIGNKKPQSYFRDVVWHRSNVEMAVQRPVPERWKEYIGLWGWSDELRSWTWPGMEGTPLTVRVYTRGDKVTVLLNGKELEAHAWQPYRWEVTNALKPGTNDLEIQVNAAPSARAGAAVPPPTDARGDPGARDRGGRTQGAPATAGGAGAGGSGGRGRDAAQPPVSGLLGPVRLVAR